MNTNRNHSQGQESQEPQAAAAVQTAIWAARERLKANGLFLMPDLTACLFVDNASRKALPPFKLKLLLDLPPPRARARARPSPVTPSPIQPPVVCPAALPAPVTIMVTRPIPTPTLLPLAPSSSSRTTTRRPAFTHPSRTKVETDFALSPPTRPRPCPQSPDNPRPTVIPVLQRTVVEIDLTDSPSPSPPQSPSPAHAPPDPNTLPPRLECIPLPRPTDAIPAPTVPRPSSPALAVDPIPSASGDPEPPTQHSTPEAHPDSLDPSSSPPPSSNRLDTNQLSPPLASQAEPPMPVPVSSQEIPSRLPADDDLSPQPTALPATSSPPTAPASMVPPPSNRPPLPTVTHAQKRAHPDMDHEPTPAKRPRMHVPSPHVAAANVPKPTVASPATHAAHVQLSSPGLPSTRAATPTLQGLPSFLANVTPTPLGPLPQPSFLATLGGPPAWRTPTGLPPAPAAPPPPGFLSPITLRPPALGPSVPGTPAAAGAPAAHTPSRSAAASGHAPVGTATRSPGVASIASMLAKELQAVGGVVPGESAATAGKTSRSSQQRLASRLGRLW